MTQAGPPSLPERPTLPERLTLPALQDYVRRMVEARGFITNPNKIFILLVEEVGELATEFKHRAYYPERFDRQNLSHELIDILLYLLDLANGFSVDLAGLWPEHERHNDARFSAKPAGGGKPAAFRADYSLNQLCGHVEHKRAERGFEDRDEMLVILLSEEVGEIARELRKHWKGLASSRDMGMEIIDALTYVLRLGGCFAVDFEQALTEKERVNAARDWAY